MASFGTWSEHEFVRPSRGIMNPEDFEAAWKTSESLSEILEFVKLCTESVIGKRISAVDGKCEIVDKFVSFMKLMQNKVEEIPPLKQPMRFGNKAFKQWYACLIEETDKFLDDLLPAELSGAKVELAPYIITAFGNEVRIDYGTGHEMTIMVFFLCLYKLRLITAADCDHVVLHGFVEYIKTMRCLQNTYLLEPAGSHGAWGLDDYHCLVFLWGAAQLCDSTDSAGTAGTVGVVSSADPTGSVAKEGGAEKMASGEGGEKKDAQKQTEKEVEDRITITPRSIHDETVLLEESCEYLYLEGIQFIKKLKTGAPFSETSPMLYNISMQPNIAWSKVCSGMLRLFQAEVLLKFPVVQHMLFGTILKAPVRK